MSFSPASGGSPDDVAQVVSATVDEWRGRAEPELQAVVERGGVVALPALPFEVTDRERALFTTSITDEQRKSIYLRAGRDGVSGIAASDTDRVTVSAMIRRYAAGAHALIDGLFPGYRAADHAIGTSFRPRAIGDVSSGQALSWRKDDTRLHIDAFPSNPTHGDRILRVFTNVHPATMPRSWRVGESFASMAARFLPRTSGLPPGAAWLLHRLRVTKRPRSAYDHLMLQLHDLAKADATYQRTCPQRSVDFPPGTTWICFSDQVMHAAMAGQFLFEQTYRLPLTCIRDVDASPLRTLERLTSRSLA